jgi:hypothetical protein
MIQIPVSALAQYALFTHLRVFPMLDASEHDKRLPNLTRVKNGGNGDERAYSFGSSPL